MSKAKDAYKRILGTSDKFMVEWFCHKYIKELEEQNEDLREKLKELNNERKIKHCQN